MPHDIAGRLRATDSWFLESVKRSSFVGKNNVTIAYGCVTQPDPHAPVLVLFTGWSETFVKYAELMFDLYMNAGVSIYSMDHRDQGFSGRERDGVSQMTFIESFEDHLVDADRFVRGIVIPETSSRAAQATSGREYHNGRPPPLMGFGFSLGGLVLSRLATTDPHLFDCLILPAPALVPYTLGLPAVLVEALCDIACAMGSCDEFVPGHGEKPDGSLQRPPDNRVSESLERILVWERIREEFPETNINGMSFSHLREMLRFRLTRRQALEQLDMPILLLTAGRDTFVDNNGHIAMSQYSPLCEMISFANAKHEIHFETDDIRSQAINAMVDFIRKNNRKDATDAALVRSQHPSDVTVHYRSIYADGLVGGFENAHPIEMMPSQLDRQDALRTGLAFVVLMLQLCCAPCACGGKKPTSRFAIGVLVISGLVASLWPVL